MNRKVYERHTIDTLDEENIAGIIEKCRAALAGNRISESGSSQFLETADTVLHDFLHFFPDAKVRWRMRSRLGRIELNILVRGEKRNLLEEGNLKDSDFITSGLRALKDDMSVFAGYRYIRETNIITICSPPPEDRQNILRQPMFQAVVLGVTAGLIARQLPASVNAFLLNDLASPLMSIILDITAGVMAPVVFLSLIIAISSLDSISMLNNWGSRIFRRFLHCTVRITLAAILISLVFFPVFGQSSTVFEARVFIDMILDIIPVDLISPFVENNVQQIVILALGLGAALLIISERMKKLISLLQEIRDWLNELMEIVYMILPVIPFLSVFTVIAAGEAGTLLSGWKYILSSYVCFLACFIFKFLIVSFRCHIPAAELLQRIRPLARSAFSLGSETACMPQFRELAEKGFGIDEKYSSFWTPLSYAMLAPTTAVSYIIAPFFVAELTGTPASINFLMILFILTVQMSLASPGMMAGWALLFQALGLPAGYIGFLSAYGIFIDNAATACDASYRILEIVEAAHVMGMDSSLKDDVSAADE